MGAIAPSAGAPRSVTAMNQDIGLLFPDLERDLRAFTTGIFPSQEIEKLVRKGAVTGREPICDDQIQPASLDLRLGPVAYRVRASFLPGERSTVARKIASVLMHEVDLGRPAVLEKGCVYIVPLLEELNLPPDVSGKANPKSSTGRLDVFTRLLSDYGTEFERVAPGYKGRLYLEVVPRTFSILVREGARLNQLRFMRGAPPASDSALDDLHSQEVLVYSADGTPQQALIEGGLWLSVDLAGSDENPIIGYRAKRHAPLIDIAKVNYYDPLEFWDPVHRTASRSIVLDPDDFYILASKERIRIPPNYSAAMVAYDPSVGEFRIHYAGFFDPGFGYGRNDIKGTRAVLEVRSHEVPFLIEDGQIVGRLIYERLLTAPHRLYGQEIGSSYQKQDIALSKHFRSLR
jgi:dCTP deaminase